VLDFKEENTKNSKIPIGILDENGSQQHRGSQEPLGKCRTPQLIHNPHLSTTRPQEPPYFEKAGILEFSYISIYLSIFFFFFSLILKNFSQ